MVCVYFTGIIYFVICSFYLLVLLECAVPENIHTPPQKGLEFPGGWGVLKDQKLEQMYET